MAKEENREAAQYSTTSGETVIIAKGIADVDVIKTRIYEVRGLRVMLDRDLAELYGVETRALDQAVRRNIKRFPEDFMFVMTGEEMNAWKSQIVMSNSIRMGMRRPPVVFTELGIAMLSSVLRSETAIQVNINIMRAFVAIRHAVSAWQGVNMKVEQLSHKVDQLNNYVEEILHDRNDINRMQEQTNNELALQIESTNDALDQLREQPAKPRKRIGYKPNEV